VADRLGVVGARPEPVRQVAAQVAARESDTEAARRQEDALARPPGRPREQRAAEQQGRARLRDAVHQPDPLLMGVQCRPVGEPGGDGGQRGRHANRGQRGRGSPRPAAAEGLEQQRRSPAAEREPDQDRVGGLSERHPVQRVGPPAGRQRADHRAGQRVHRVVQGRRALDALGERQRGD